MAESKESTPRPARRRLSLQMLLVVAVAFLTVWAAIGLALGLNAFGRNISGTVTCAKGNVTGVFIEAERAPRVGSYEVQSGFADWWLHTSSLQTASFEYWLPYGGAYAIHFGCGTLQKPGTVGGWATNNRTPVIDVARTDWTCGNLQDNQLYNQPFTLVVTDCRQT